MTNIYQRDSAGINLKIIDGGSSSGTESSRVFLGSPLGYFGLCCELVDTSSQAGLCGASLYGTAAKSTSITTAQATELVSWSTNTGLTAYSSTDGARYPVTQIWAVVTDAATSVTSDIDVWVSAIP